MKYLNLSFKEIVLFVFAGFLVSTITGCEQKAEQQETQTIRMIYANWSEGVAMTHLSEEILKEHLGYEVVTKMTDIESVFEELSRQEYDVFVDAWLPKTHSRYMEEYGDELIDLGVNVEQVRTGLVVPDYMEVQSIADLQADTIMGISSGAGVMAATEEAIGKYKLPSVLKVGNEQSMTEALDDAIKHREPVVVTGWTPHWISNRYSLKFLDDPQNVYGESEKIHTITRNGFTADHPRAAVFFERFKLTEKQLGALMDELQTFPDNEKRAVRNWMDDNEFIINQWIRGLDPERQKVM